MLLYQYKINESVINSKNCRNSDLRKLVFKIADKIDLERSDKYVAFLNLSIYNP